LAWFGQSGYGALNSFPTAKLYKYTQTTAQENLILDVSKITVDTKLQSTY